MLIFIASRYIGASSIVVWSSVYKNDVYIGYGYFWLTVATGGFTLDVFCWFKLLVLYPCAFVGSCFKAYVGFLDFSLTHPIMPG